MPARSGVNRGKSMFSEGSFFQRASEAGSGMATPLGTTNTRSTRMSLTQHRHFHLLGREKAAEFCGVFGGEVDCGAKLALCHNQHVDFVSAVVD